MRSWEYIGRSAEATRRLGESMGRHAFEGLYLAVRGELGAGKTHLAKGVAAGLGLAAEIVSPTFTILNEYETDTSAFHHFDLYRLEDEVELYGIGFEEFGRSGVTLVEWADKFPAALPLQAVQVEITVVDSATRRIRITANTPAAERWLEEVEHDLAGA